MTYLVRVLIDSKTLFEAMDSIHLDTKVTISNSSSSDCVKIKEFSPMGEKTLVSSSTIDPDLGVSTRVL